MIHLSNRKEDDKMAKKKKAQSSSKKKSGCVNIYIVEAGYNGKKWTI